MTLRPEDRGGPFAVAAVGLLAVVLAVVFALALIWPREALNFIFEAESKFGRLFLRAISVAALLWLGQKWWRRSRRRSGEAD